MAPSTEQTDREPVEHWFDFICPFCYLGQTRTSILRKSGLVVEELPFQIHPEIGPGGAPAPDRVGPMYEGLATAAREAGLPLRWSSRIAFSRPALALSEMVRIHSPADHAGFVANVFAAYFGEGRDIERPDVLIGCLAAAGLPRADALIEAAPIEGEAALVASEERGRAAGVTGTPAWLIDGRLVVGLRPEATFAALAGRVAA